MLDAVIAWDHQALNWILEHCRYAWLDGPMYVASHLKYFLPIIIPSAAYVLWKGNYKWRGALFVSLFLVLITDQLSASLLKPLVGRARPFSPSFSFPSSHATNVFGQAAFWGSFYKPARLWLLLFAAVVGFSRVYLAKHYPLDVLGGAVIGAICGYTLYLAFKRWLGRGDRT